MKIKPTATDFKSADYGERSISGVGSKGEIMSSEDRLSHPIYGLLPTEIEGFDSLAELALDMRWSWNHATDRVWRSSIPSCGNSRIIPGSSCRRSRATKSSAAGRPGFPQERR